MCVFEIRGNPSKIMVPRKRPYTVAEDKQMLNFWAKYAEKSPRELSRGEIWRIYIERTRSRRTYSSLNWRFNARLLPKLWKMNDFGTRTKVKMYFRAKGSLDKRYLRELRKNADVETNEQDRIIYYKEHESDGLVLKDPSYQPSRRTIPSPPRRKRPPPRKRVRCDDSSSEEEEEEEEEEESGEASGEEDEEESGEREVINEDPFDDDLIFDGPEIIPRPIPIVPMVKHEPRHYFDHDEDSMQPQVMASNEMEILVTSLKEMFTAQTSMMRELVHTTVSTIKATGAGNSGPVASAVPAAPVVSAELPGPSTSSTSPTTSSTSTAPPCSKKGFLYLLRALVLGLDRPELDSMRSRITQEINNLRAGDKDLPLDTIHLALECLMDKIDS